MRVQRAQLRGREREVDVTRAAGVRSRAGSRASSRSLTPSKVTKLRSRVVDSDTVTACGFGRPLHVDDADAVPAQGRGRLAR